MFYDGMDKESSKTLYLKISIHRTQENPIFKKISDTLGEYAYPKFGEMVNL